MGGGGDPIREAMEPGAPAGSSLKPIEHGAAPSRTPVHPTAGPSWTPVHPTAGPSRTPVQPTAGPSRTPVQPTAGPSRTPVHPTAGPSWTPVQPTAGPSWTPVHPTAGPSRTPVDPTAGPSHWSMAPTAGPSSASTSGSGVTVRIFRQPAKKAPKFRYESENRIPEPITGADSTEDGRRTYPAIEITNHIGKVIIVVSCVTKDKPYRPHPHKLVGPGEDFCDGLCVMKEDITPETRVVTFSNIGIVCVTKNDIAKSLALRKKQNIDPFHTGFDHGTSAQVIDLNAVRLCFQVYLKKTEGWHMCPAIVSNVINKHNLEIMNHSSIFGSAEGGTKVILICEKMQPEDVVVTLHTGEGAGGAAWSATVPRESVRFYHKVAVVFYTPPYKHPDTRSPITAYIQLHSLSTGERSNSVLFTYEPSPDPGPHYIKEKRKKPLPKELIERLGSIPQFPTPVLYHDDLETEPCENVPPVRMDISPMPVPHETSNQPMENNSDSSIDNLSPNGELKMDSGEQAALIQDLFNDPLSDEFSKLLNVTDNFSNSDSE